KRREVAGCRRAIFDSILLIAFRQHSILKDLPLCQAFGNSITISIESKVASEFVSEQLLQHPDMAHIQCLIVEDGRADNDRVEIIRVSLGFHQSLMSAGRATFDVGPLWVRTIVGL